MKTLANPFAYPVKVQEDGDAYTLTFRDIKEAITFSDTKEDIEQDAIDAIKDIASAYISDGRPFPLASKKEKGEIVVELPLSFAIKIVLHNAMLANRYRQTDLAKLLDVPTSEVARIVNPKKPVKIDTMVKAVRAVGGSVSLAFAI